MNVVQVALSIVGTLASVFGAWIGLQSRRQREAVKDRGHRMVTIHQRIQFEDSLKRSADRDTSETFSPYAFARARELARAQWEDDDKAGGIWDPDWKSQLSPDAPPRRSLTRRLLLFRIESIALLRSEWPRPRRPSAQIPGWALIFLGEQEAQRYAKEWGAHLRQLIEEGELDRAGKDRRRLALRAILLSIEVRARRVLGRAR